MEEKACE